jgi:hypothetical protein
MDSLRRKFVNSNLANKTCKICKKEYPRNDQFFYVDKEQTAKKLNIIVYASYCIRCHNEINIKWKKRNGTKKRTTEKRYNESERGFLVNMFNSMKKRENYIASEFPDKEAFIQYWKEQKVRTGWICPGTGITMTTKIPTMNIKKSNNPTNLSSDRILPWVGYTKKNLIFTCWKYNNDKNAMTPKMAKAYLRIVKERYGTDEME